MPEAGLPEPVCTSGTQYTMGTSAFREVTDAWGLSAMEVRGFRLNVLDIDNDGYPDLWVRLGGDEENFAPGERRRRWAKISSSAFRAGGQNFLPGAPRQR